MFNQREISWLLDNMSGNRFNNGCSEFAVSDAVVQFGKNKQIIIMMYECSMDNQKTGGQLIIIFKKLVQFEQLNTFIAYLF